MAKLISVKRPLPVPPPIETVTLELTRDEARTLQYIYGVVGGDPDNSHRRHIRAIHNTLAEAGVPYESGRDNGVMAQDSHIWFNR